MLSIETLQKYDIQRMYETYDKWPEIAKNSYEQSFDLVDYSGIDHIIFAGMGGSGALGDVFSSILSKSDIHVKVVKGYLLPKTVDANTLVVATSVSGETIETLTILQEACKLNCKVIGFSTGGKLEKYCNKNGVEFRKISMVHSPRASFTGYLYSMLKILSSVIPINNLDIIESINSLKVLRENIASHNLNQNNESLSLAKWLSGIPMIYYPFGLKAAAIRFKNSLQENTKLHAITEDIVESCHNGIVAWEHNSIVHPILIQGSDDYMKTKERWKIIEEFFNDKKIDYRVIKSINGNILSKLINLIYLCDYSTIYRAVLSEIDPSPVDSIDFIKNRI